ncbi:MAG: formylmethanofuran dehydrogenase subunit C [Methanomicrobium sp.]|nr:formylmethanofuran dehydrogenase subunit C [Methanomicrobium sp.]MDD4126308.1 formylmethanofuran dehydrogenase subunit C [Methanomicrobium sp.]
MSTVTITTKGTHELYLEAYNVTPDAFAGKTAAEIANLECHEGNLKSKLGEYFTIEGNGGATAADTKIIVRGDCKKVKRIGQQMTAGEIIVESDCDMYTAGWMKGGKVHVKGNVDSFCGIGMEGGEFIVEGDAQNHLGSAYRGDWRGMTGGVIHVKGNAGNDVANFMRGGKIIIDGDAFIHVSTHAEGGTVIIKGNVESRVGGQMVKGDVYVFGDIKYMMPGYKHVGDVEAEVEGETAKFAHYIGDLGERHSKRKGEVVYGNIYLKI